MRTIIAIALIAAVASASTKVVKANYFECQACKTVVDHVESFLTQASTVEEAKVFLDKYCAQFSNQYYVDACEVLANGTVNVIADFISRIPSDKICSAISLCDATTVMPPKIQANAFTCSSCEWVVNEAIKIIDNQGKDAAKAKIAQLCGHLSGTKADICTEVADDLYDAVWNFVKSNINAHAVCVDINMCADSVSIAKKSVHYNVECPICEFFVSKVEDYLNQSKTEDEIITKLQSECSVFKSLSDYCNTLVAVYVPKIIDAFEAKQTPANICKDLKACDAVQHKMHHMKHVMRAMKNVRGNALNCAVCTDVAQNVVNAVQEKESNIPAQVCKSVDGFLNGVCVDYVKQLIEQLNNNACPSGNSVNCLCKAINACDN